MEDGVKVRTLAIPGCKVLSAWKVAISEICSERFLFHVLVNIFIRAYMKSNEIEYKIVR
jgi:hypothetical protein